jgi:hypothetical protein
MAWHAHVLVVANVTATSSELQAALIARAEKAPIRVTLLMPAKGPGISGREAVREHCEEAVAAWREAGLEAEGQVGDANPVDAVAEAWDPRLYDEVVISTLPGETSKWIRSDLPNRVANLTGVPVTHVISADPNRAPKAGPVPARETSPLGPLGVLSWGGRGHR